MGVEPGNQEGPSCQVLGRVLVLIKNTRFVRDNGTNQTQEGYRGQNPVSMKLLVRDEFYLYLIALHIATFISKYCEFYFLHASSLSTFCGLILNVMRVLFLYFMSQRLESHASQSNHKINESSRTHCNTLQHTATHCNTLQHTATHSHQVYESSKYHTARNMQK